MRVQEDRMMRMADHMILWGFGVLMSGGGACLFALAYAIVTGGVCD